MLEIKRVTRQEGFDESVIYLTRGDAAHIAVGIELENKQPYTMVDGDVLQFTLKETADDHSEILIQKRFTEPVLDLTSDDTKNLSFGTYVYDIQLTMANGEPFTIVPHSRFKIEKEVG